MKSFFTGLFLFFLPFMANAQLLPGFKKSGSFQEQQMVIENSPMNTRMLINAPLNGFGKKNRVLLILYALPNGNTIEQTFGKKMKQGDDWHYNIQHIAAQTRFIRKTLKRQTVVVAYLEAGEKSWPLWTRSTPGYLADTKEMVNKITSLFRAWNPKVVLAGHSGGGRFIFNYLEAVGTIPDEVERIAFLDSDYGYKDSIHGPQLVDWLKSGRDKFLSVLAYNDSVVTYHGKPVVSPTGGTWYRSKRMIKYLSGYFHFREKDRDTLQWYISRRRRIEFILKTNPGNKIYHTVQVERNGFVQSMLSGTRHEQKRYRYFGNRAYSGFISDSIQLPIRCLNIPPRPANAETGSVFMKRITPLPMNEREEAIFHALSTGNMPDFLRNTITLHGTFADANGTEHRVSCEVMPDYLAVGSNTDFCRIPMTPQTAQRLANLFGASLLTAKLSDQIDKKASVRLAPYPYRPVGHQNETVEKFVAHNAMIEQQLAKAGAKEGQLVSGIKKDVILSSRIARQPGKVVIYGWYKPDGTHIQPVYSGHANWYVDYSHGIRLVNNEVLVDGKRMLLSNILSDPVLYKLFSNEDTPMEHPSYLP